MCLLHLSGLPVAYTTASYEVPTGIQDEMVGLVVTRYWHFISSEHFARPRGAY